MREEVELCQLGGKRERILGNHPAVSAIAVVDILQLNMLGALNVGTSFVSKKAANLDQILFGVICV